MCGKQLIVFCFLLLNFSVSKADERFGAVGKFSIETNYQFGRIIPHNKKFKAPVTDFTHSLEISFYKQTMGEKAWQRKLHYPEIGGSFVFAGNGDQQVFGNAYLFMIVSKFWIVRSRYVDFYLRVGTGLAVVPHPFDLVDNPKNNAIGSVLNSADQFRLGVDLKPHAQVHMSVGLTFTHYSNAGTQVPNLGVNVPALNIGIRYFPKVSAGLRYNRNRVPKPEKKNEVMIKLGVGYQESQTYYGPKYPIYIGTINFARYTSIANKVLAGACVEFNQGNYDFNRIQEIDVKYSRVMDVTQFSIFVGDEILLGRVGLFFIAGGYIFPVRKDPPVYAKLGLNYYFPDFGKNKSRRFFIGTSLKTHYLAAQYYELSTGVAF